jgi:hypothetical protein
LVTWLKSRVGKTVSLAILVGLTLLVAAPVASAAEEGSIAGTVRARESGAPIENILVCAYGPDRGCVLSDAGGEYEIPALPAGTYVVEFSGEFKHVNYFTQFFEDKTKFEEGTPVSVESGVTTEGIDAELDPGGKIEGTVEEVGGGAVAGIEVCAFAQEGAVLREPLCAFSEPDGRYEVQRLPAATYLVEFQTTQNYLEQWFEDKPDLGEATPVPAGPGVPASGIDAHLQPGATIGGHVFDAATNSPLAGILVCAIDVTTVRPVNCPETKADGSYLMTKLVPGDYKVAFSPEFSEFEETEAEGEDDGFATRFWNEASSLGAATVLHPTAAEPASGIDARLLPETKAEAAPPPEEAKPPAPLPPVVTPPRRVTCRRGFHRKRVRGKVRCVRNRRVHRHRHHRHRKGTRASLK